MAGYPVDIGTAPNDKTGDELRDAFENINGTTIEIQYINALAASDVANSSNTIPVATGLGVTITPKLSTSRLIVSFSSNWEFVSTQEGCQIEYQYSTDNYVTSTEVTAAFHQTSTGSQTRAAISGQIEIPNPGQQIKCRIIFTAQLNGFSATYMGTRGGFISITEEI